MILQRHFDLVHVQGIVIIPTDTTNGAEYHMR